MDKYVVIRSFTDKDSQIHYTVGDRYPHRGFASKSRVDELSTTRNKRGVVLIQKENVSNATQDVAEKKEYTKSDIESMTVAELRELAKEKGIENADSSKGAKLKELLIENMGL